ncbi:hypothetical protein [Thioclava sp.]|uniref:hypothetical protein n=1 Tax=Thioclava sp. TaxID=1933450 RepID=UPI003AA8E5EB
MNANRKPGPKLPYTDEMLEKAVDMVEADPDVSEFNQKNVVEKLNLLYGLKYRPRAGDMECNIIRVLKLREDREARSKISSLPSDVVAKFDASLKDFRFQGLLNISDAHVTLIEQAQIPLVEAEHEVCRMRAAYDAERAARLQEEKRAAAFEDQTLRLQKKLGAAERKVARLERKVQALSYSGAKNGNSISKEDLATLIGEIVAKNGS